LRARRDADPSLPSSAEV